MEVKTSFSVPSIFAVAGLTVALIAIPAYALDVSGDTLTFPNGSGDIGTAAAAGTSVSYTNVATVGGTQIDATVTFISATNLDNDDDSSNGCDNVLDYIDEDPGSSPADDALSPQFDVCDGQASGSATIRINFFDGGTPLALTDLSVLVKDIDAEQFVSVETPSSYELSDTPATLLSVTTGTNTVTFTEPLGAGSSDSDEENWVVMNFDSASSLVFTFGANDTGSGSLDFIFAATSWTSPPTTTVPTYASAATVEDSIESQGIFLFIAREAGDPVAESPVYYGSVSIKPNTTYILSLQSVTNPALTRTVLATGTVNDWGHLDARLEMGTLRAGTYKVVMTGTHRLGYPLVLTNYISVDANGNFVSISPESLQPTLS